MKKLSQLEKYLNVEQTPSQEDQQKLLSAIGWNDYHVGYHGVQGLPRDNTSSDEISKVFSAINKEDGEIIVIKKIPKDVSRISYAVLYSREHDCVNIPRKRRLNTKTDFIFIATEYVAHQFNELKTMFMNKEINTEKVKNIFIGYCNGLDYIHNIANVIHRDIKPENLRFDIEGKNKEIISKIIDFELACQRDASLTVRGTAGYKAPELIRKNAESVESDIYALGICGAELLSTEKETIPEQIGKLKRLDKKLIAEHEKIEKDKSLNSEQKEVESGKANIKRYWETIPAVSAEEEFLIEVFKNATRPNPEDRYQTAIDMQQDLEIILQEKRIRKIIEAFKHVGTVSEKVKNGSTFDLDNAEKASQLKKEWFSDLIDSGIDPKKSKIVIYIQNKIKEKVKPVKDEAQKYLNQLLGTKNAESADSFQEASYASQIHTKIAGMDKLVKQHVLELANCLNRLYSLCEIKDPLINILLKSPELKKEESRQNATNTYQSLMELTNRLEIQTFILDDADTSEASIINSRIKNYLKELQSKQIIPKDAKKCIELKELLTENNKLIRATDDKLCENLDEILKNIETQLERADAKNLKSAYFSLGLDSAKQGKLTEAIAYLEKAKQHSPVPDAKIEYNLGCFYHIGNQTSEALKQYRLAGRILKSSKMPESTALINNAAIIAAESGKKFDLISKSLMSAINQDETNFEVKYNLGVVSIENQDYAAAIEQFETAINIRPLPELNNFLAFAYFKTGELNKAQEHMKAYLQGLAKRIEQSEKNKNG